MVKFSVTMIIVFVLLGFMNICALGEEDCFNLGEAQYYAGTKNTTPSGLTCQRWDKQVPHDHKYKDEQFPEGSLCKAKNYCRDPGNEGFTWCYTTDPNTRWEACGIPWCDEPPRNNNTHDCYILTSEDRESGKTEKEMCEMNPYRSRVCNASSHKPEGCESCDDCCQEKDCYPYTIYEYTGTWHRGESGRECQRWDEQSPHKHSNNMDYKFGNDGSVHAAQNYCRDPDYSGFLWCYTMDPNVRWEKCSIAEC
ncbi:plasminogen-like [Mercenaria mercenaria]|uniref:plasminogen-like n=1 Tax=Mercenaria mercenaria TaxID=6596 RepID=UPI00234F054B|nr:plasminogen-like [Mercenaria mercenaria]